MKNNLKLILVSVLVLPLLVTAAHSQDNITLQKFVIGGGGMNYESSTGSEGQMYHSSTLGQTAIEVHTQSGTEIGALHEGFWTPDAPRGPNSVEENVTTGRSLNNYPNPFSDNTTIEFELDQPANVSLRIYDINGSLVKTLASGKRFSNGEITLDWDATDEFGTSVSSGSYLYELSVEPISGGRSFSLRNVMVVNK